jgi:hypothetical protein
VHCIWKLHIVALVDHWSLVVLVTLGGCRHLAGLELWWFVREIGDHLRSQSSWFMRGFDPTSRSAKGYSSGLLMSSCIALGIESCDTQVMGLACYASECANHSPWDSSQQRLSWWQANKPQEKIWLYSSLLPDLIKAHHMYLLSYLTCVVLVACVAL